MTVNPITTGVQAYTSAVQRAQNSATEIAQSSLNGNHADLAGPLVELKAAEQQASAAAKIIEVEKSQIGTLLDVLS